MSRARSPGTPARARTLICVAALAPVLGLCLACGPIGPFPGGPLRGNEVTEPVEDWSFAARRQEIQIETRPESPYSVNVWCIVQGGALYVPSGKPEGKRWVKNVLEDERVRVRVGNDVYLARAVRVSDAEEQRTVIGDYVVKYNVPDPEGEGSERDVWMFRIDPRSG